MPRFSLSEIPSIARENNACLSDEYIKSLPICIQDNLGELQILSAYVCNVAGVECLVLDVEE
jgi:hypothetical protein